MGLRVNIYRNRYDSPSNAFYGRDVVVVTNIAGPFEPTTDAPSAWLAKNALGDPVIMPYEKPDGLVGPMMGGTFAHTSDSRFAEATGIYGAVAIHDRFEAPENRMED
jgi:hypothetical protein